MRKISRLLALLATTTILSTGSFLRTQAIKIELVPGSESANQVPPWYEQVGATTPFNHDNAIDIKEFCNQADAAHVNGDSTDCVRRWMQAGKEQGKHLFASTGTYTLNRHIVIFNGMHLKCEDPKSTTFKKITGNWQGKFRSHEYHETEPVLSDILIEHCGFDMNGDPGNFASAFQFTNVNHVTFRGNRIFDQTDVECIERTCQRQYLVIVNSDNILVEHNHFSHGGRIKVGQTGQNWVIRNNHLDFVNDNGITVVGIKGINDFNAVRHVLIYGNYIENPTVTGIFLGADGEDDQPGFTVEGITVFNNKIVGRFDSACIKGTLPEFTSKIFIANNHCENYGSLNIIPDARVYLGGIRLAGYRNIPEQVTAYHNYINSHELNSFNNIGAFGITFVKACLLDNMVPNSAETIRARSNSTVLQHGNMWGVGAIVADTTSEIVEINAKSRKECFVPDFLNIVDK
ncbi:MAG: hypothetical protein AB4042_17115 [Leptolyngbyaceae cyanobacterium]